MVMKKISVIAVVFLFFLLTFNLSFVCADENHMDATVSSDSYENAYRYNIQGWIYLHIEGGGYERGYQYGYLLADEIIDTINRWINVFPQKNSWINQKKNIERLFWNKYPEEYKQEIKGIADGIADKGGKIDGETISYKDILALNEMYEYNSRYAILLYTQPFKSIIKDLFNSLKSTNFEEEHFGKCSAFIATGDATFDGRIVAAHMTNGHYRDDSWWQYYVTQRWNLILDIQPDIGHRMLISTAPGFIWSDEDYYQNDAGMILMETTLPPGRWKRSGTPIVVRARKAIQYSDSIDEMIDIFVTNNNGLMANDWVMGDTKTGEIASLELALRNHAVTRTKNGFLWSCNRPKNDKVRWELKSPFGLGIIGILTSKDFKPGPRDKKFEELKEQYYGEIDVNLAKKFMTTEPINKPMFDCKLTDSKLVNDFGMWAYYGFVNGTDKALVEQYKNLPGITDIPSCGWVNIYGITEYVNYRKSEFDFKNKEYNNDLLWSYQTEQKEFGNAICSNIKIDENNMYFTSWNGKIYCLDLKGNKIWNKQIGWSSTSTPTIKQDLVFVGSSNGVFALNKENGDIIWQKEIGTVASNPTVYKNQVFCASTNGYIYSLNIKNGEIIWKYKTEDDIISSPNVYKDVVYAGSNENKFHAFDVKTGERLWTFNTKAPVTSEACFYNDFIIIGSNDHNLYALDKKDGNVEWKFTTGWGITTKPVIYKKTIFVGSLDNNLYAINADDGKILWQYTTNAAIHSSPIVYGDCVFFGSDDGQLYSVDIISRKTHWVAKPDYSIQGIHSYVTKPIVSSPAASDGKIFFGSTNGNVYCYNAMTIQQIEKRDKNKEKDNSIFLVIILFLLLILGLFYFLKYKNSKK